MADPATNWAGAGPGAQTYPANLRLTVKDVKDATSP